MERGTILIVDTDATQREAMAAALQGAGHRTDEVLNAAAALRYLQARPDCQLVLSNFDLPASNGIALLDWVSLEFSGVPVILFSRSAQTEQVVEAFRHGAYDFLTAPSDKKMLIVTAGVSLERGRMRRQSLAYRQNLEELIHERTARLRTAMTDLERSYDTTLEAMGDALDLRDAETEGHSKRVTAYTIALAKAMHLSPGVLKTIARGAFLHDIGKIATPDAILLKPGKLTPEETEIMREHCRVGYEAVRKIPFLADAAEIVYSHQESFDGSGYPRKLKGEQIPLGARIFSIADTLDAMTSDRPYRKSMPFQEAIQEIQLCEGSQFDPTIVKVFLSLPRDSWSVLRQSTGRDSQAIELFRAAAA